MVCLARAIIYYGGGHLIVVSLAFMFLFVFALQFIKALLSGLIIRRSSGLVNYLIYRMRVLSFTIRNSEPRGPWIFVSRLHRRLRDSIKFWHCWMTAMMCQYKRPSELTVVRRQDEQEDHGCNGAE